MAVHCTIDTKDRMLVIDAHIDRDLSQAEIESEITAMLALHRKLRVRTIAASDFNTDRKPNSLMDRVLGQESQLPGLHIPYPPGTHTNYTFYRGREVATEIDYILVSNDLTLLSNAAVRGLASHRYLVGDVHVPNGLFQVSAFKRYKHSVTPPGTRLRLAVLVALYGCWLQPHKVQPDEWIHVYWMLADPLLPSKNTGQSTKALIKIGSAFKKGTSARLVQQWHEAMKELMFLRSCAASE